jgi:hypothetical protein
VPDLDRAGRIAAEANLLALAKAADDAIKANDPKKLADVIAQATKDQTG